MPKKRIFTTVDLTFFQKECIITAYYAELYVLLHNNLLKERWSWKTEYHTYLIWRLFILNFFETKIKRIVALVCVLMTVSALIIVPAFATEEPVEFGHLYGVVDTNTLNVREYASENAPIVAELYKYTYVKVNWVEPGWVCVAYNNDGLIGYVS